MPVRLTAMMRSHSVGSRSRKVPPWLTPAQSTSTSSRPNSRTVAATAASTAARSRTSSGIAIARPPAARIRAATVSAAAPSMSADATAAPSRANASAPAPPMPPPAPATSATFPSTRPIAILPADEHEVHEIRKGSSLRAKRSNLVANPPSCPEIAASPHRRLAMTRFISRTCGRQVEIRAKDGSAARPDLTVHSGVLVQAAVAEEAAIEVEEAGELGTCDHDISTVWHPDVVDLPSLAAQPNLRARRQIHTERPKRRSQRRQSEALDPMRRIRQVEDRSGRDIDTVEDLRGAQGAADQAAVEDLDLRTLRS